MAERTVADDKVPARSEERSPTTREAERYLVPAVDIYETDDGLTLVADMPGVDRDDVDIQVDNNVLTIEGKITHPERPNPTYEEFDLLSYFRQFSLSSELDTDRIEAELRNGVLTVSLPRSPKASPKQIEVKVS